MKVVAEMECYPDLVLVLRARDVCPSAQDSVLSWTLRLDASCYVSETGSDSQLLHDVRSAGCLTRT